MGLPSFDFEVFLVWLQKRLFKKCLTVHGTIAGSEIVQALPQTIKKPISLCCDARIECIQLKFCLIIFIDGDIYHNRFDFQAVMQQAVEGGVYGTPTISPICRRKSP